MIVNNKKRTISFQLRRFLYLFLLSVIIVLLYNISFFRDPFMGISREIFALIFTCLFLFYYLTGVIRNYHFFYYTDNGSKLVFRYYSLRPLSKKQSSIEIDKVSFNSFTIDRVFLGFMVKLYLFQKLPNGKVAKYAPVNITLLSKKEILLLEESLNSYQQ